MSKKVYVGMSGGVDSSVSAYLLQKEGRSVRGVFMKNWSDSVDEMGRCSWRAERRDAMRVAALLDIPFAMYDFEKEYRAEVGEYLFREYAAGRTPNPDIVCNKEIKIPLFLRKALAEGAEQIATGHYARSWQSKDGVWQLLKGVDPEKDQSYFLYTLTQEYLSKLLFPVGHLLKTEVRAVASRAGVPVAQKKDSTGICFIGEVDLKEFLAQRLPKKQGDILDTDGRKLGEHDGVWFYTIGQRHGLILPGGTLPYYVARKDMRTNTLIVAHEHDQKWLYATTVLVKDMHWISGVAPKDEFACVAKARYRQADEACIVRPVAGGYEVVFHRPQRALTTGQSVVLYDGEVCLGGGAVDEVRELS